MPDLNHSQVEARDHFGSNLLILAGAGAGKTETIAARALNIAGLEGSTGLTLITFTKKAALSLKERFEQVHGTNHNAFIGTFHSLCWRIILEFGYRLGIDASWTIMDQEDSIRLMKMNSSGVDANECLKVLSYSRNSNITVDDAINEPRFANFQNNRDLIIQATEIYSKKTKLNKRLDFDTLLTTANKLITDFPDIKEIVNTRFKYILVDEYQDTSFLQFKLLENLNTGKNITVVGDDAQSIYSFRAARIQNILEFESQFLASRVILNINYRCPKKIFDMAEASLRFNQQRLDREINAAILEGSSPFLIEASDQSKEAERVGKEINRLIDNEVLPNKICVLYRANRLSLPLQQTLKNMGIKFTLPDEDDFFSLPHIKSVMNVLRLVNEPEDRVALSAVFDLLSPNNLAEFNSLDRNAELRQTSFWDVIEENNPLRYLGPKLVEIKTNDNENIPVVESLGLVISFLEDSLKKLSGGGSIWQLWLADLAILQTLAQPFSSLNDFLSSIQTQNLTRNSEEENSVLFNSIHSAKGLEWDYVFVIGLVEFWFPMKLAITDQGNDEEERRLFYVASTRARKELYLSTFSRNVNPYGRVMDQQISRFLNEVKSHLINIWNNNTYFEF